MTDVKINIVMIPDSSFAVAPFFLYHPVAQYVNKAHPPEHIRLWVG